MPSSLEKLHKSMNVDSSRRGLTTFFFEFFFHIQRMNYVLYNRSCNPQCDNGFLRVLVHLLPYNSIFICKDQPFSTKYHSSRTYIVLYHFQLSNNAFKSFSLSFCILLYPLQKVHLFPRVCLSCNKYHYLHLQKFQNLFVCLYCSFALINLYVLPMLLWRCLFFSRSTWSCFTTFVVHCFKSSNSR